MTSTIKDYIISKYKLSSSNINKVSIRFVRKTNLVTVNLNLWMELRSWDSPKYISYNDKLIDEDKELPSLETLMLDIPSNLTQKEYIKEYAKSNIICNKCTNGIYKCISCNNGMLICSMCSGKGSRTCSVCIGLGYRKCLMCPVNNFCGNAYVINNTNRYVRCNKCMDTGKIYCSACNGSKIATCLCLGNGVIKCQECLGNINIVCPLCFGTSKVTKIISYKINIINVINEDMFTDIFDNTNVTNYIFNIKNTIKQCNYNRVLIYDELSNNIKESIKLCTTYNNTNVKCRTIKDDTLYYQYDIDEYEVAYNNNVVKVWVIGTNNIILDLYLTTLFSTIGKILGFLNNF